jgi:hypothetical protein
MIDHDHGERAALPITLLVAPASGRLRILPPRGFVGGAEWLEAGQAVLSIDRGAGDPEMVRSPARGRLGGVLGRDGEPVRAGQAVAWMEPV